MDNSPFNRLSTELRNRIYESVFSPTRTVECLDQLAIGNIQHPLTKSCRQIRSETLMMDYANTDYEAPGLDSWYHSLDDGDGDVLSEWLKRIGPQACSTMRSLYRFYSQQRCEEEVDELISRGDPAEIFDKLGHLQGLPWWASTIARTLRGMGIQLRSVERRYMGAFQTWHVEVAPPE